MSRYILAGVIIAVALGMLYSATVSRWEEIDADNNAFAKECNDRGGVANFGGSARQCYGANILPSKEKAK